MKQSESQYVDIRGLRFHVRSWGREGAPKLFMFHGWMDASASFQFLVDELAGDWHVIAPDWSGYGLSQWTDRDTYWFGDYLGDQDRLLEHYQPESEGPVNLLGHSFGATVSCVYAGIRPERIARLVNIDAYGARHDGPEERLQHYRRWMQRLRRPLPPQSYASWEELEKRIAQAHPRIPAPRVRFIARHWAREDGARVVMRNDPAHGRNDGMDITNRLDDAMAAWREITAPTLILLARQGSAVARKADLGPGATGEERFSRFRNSRQVWFEDTGHMMHLERPAELAPVIEAFLREGMGEAA